MTPRKIAGIRIDRKTTRLLGVLLSLHAVRQGSDPDFRVRTRTLMEKAEISVHTFYSLMRRLEGSGWVEGEIEVLPEGEHRPRNIYFRLTDQGAAWAREAVTEDNRRWRRLTRRTKPVS